MYLRLGIVCITDPMLKLPQVKPPTTQPRPQAPVMDIEDTQVGEIIIVDDDDSAYDEWREENVIEFPAPPPAWADAAGKVLYGTKWWDVNWMKDDAHQVVDGPEQYEDIWEKDLPWYWGRFSPEEASHIAKYPILDATQDVVPPISPKKLTESSKDLIIRLKESGMEVDDLED